tara:strand:+ start:1476 stop:1604 length:129 start_codon:yes stop_codon:yes gene_type:complete
MYKPKFSFHVTFAEFIGLGIAWQKDRAAIILPFVMFEVSWRN